jgi:hypothetical protein
MSQQPTIRAPIRTKLSGFVTASSVSLALMSASVVSCLASILSVTAMATDNWFVYDGTSEGRYNVRLSPNWLCRGSFCESFPSSSAGLCLSPADIQNRLRGISASMVMGFLFLFSAFVVLTELAGTFQWMEEYLRSTEAGTTIDRILHVKKICNRGALGIKIAFVSLGLGFLLTCIGVGLFRTSVDSYFNCGSSFCGVISSSGSSDPCFMGTGYGLGVASCVVSSLLLVLVAFYLRLILERLGEFGRASASRAVEVEENFSKKLQMELAEANAERSRRAADGTRQGGRPAAQSTTTTFKARSAAEPISITLFENEADYIGSSNTAESQPKKKKMNRPPPSASGDDVWEFDEVTELFFSQTRKLFYDAQSEQYYDPATELWYNPETREWYRLGP